MCERNGQLSPSEPLSVLCFSLRQVNLSSNQFSSLPLGLLHLTHIQRLSAAKNQLTILFDIPTSTSQLSIYLAMYFETKFEYGFYIEINNIETKLQSFAYQGHLERVASVKKALHQQ